MRILVWPQPSMRNYATGKWHLEMDPQLNKNRAWANATKDEHVWCWFLPPNSAWSDESHKGIPEHIEVHPISWAENVMANRFNFPWHSVKDGIVAFDPDVIICEVPEHVPALKFMMEFDNDIACPIVTYINYATLFPYTEKGKGVDTWDRQVEGAAMSDLLVFNTPGLKDAWMEKAVQEGLKDIERVAVWKAVYSPSEIEASSPVKADPPAIFYTSRLSDMRKNKVGEFCKAIQKLNADSGAPDFQVWIGNPNQSWNEERIHDMIPRVTRVGPPEREKYLDWVNEAAIIPTMWPQDMIYSIGYLDALAGQAISMVAAHDSSKVAGYQVPWDSGEDDMHVALRKCLEIWNDDQARLFYQTQQLDWMMAERSVERNMGQIISDLDRLVYG